VQNHGQIEGLRLVANPPDLHVWREKLFHVDDTITLTEDEYAAIPHSTHPPH
jgi:glutathione S-transferase